MYENFHGHFKKKIVGITRDGIIVPWVTLNFQKILAVSKIIAFSAPSI
jgi:hypothetical protein